MKSLSVLYRGALTSCNYSCSYCPFAKRIETVEEREADKQTLTRFTEWALAQQDLALSLFFTPWGEALVRTHYQKALVALSHAPHVKKVVFQTNLSSRLDFLHEANTEKIALWVTYHPGEVEREAFLQQCERLIAMKVRFSVGIVGKPSHFAEIAQMRKDLPQEIYLWINAYRGKSRLYPYTEEQTAYLSHIDPLFSINAKDYPSRGKSCLTGEDVISVDEHGTMFRCHFVSRPLGNIYQDNYRDQLKPRTCPRSSCYCHIGYVHMPERELYPQFEGGILERIPIRF